MARHTELAKYKNSNTKLIFSLKIRDLILTLQSDKCPNIITIIRVEGCGMTETIPRSIEVSSIQIKLMSCLKAAVGLGLRNRIATMIDIILNFIDNFIVLLQFE